MSTVSTRRPASIPLCGRVRGPHERDCVVSANDAAAIGLTAATARIGHGAGKPRRDSEDAGPFQGELPAAP